MSGRANDGKFSHDDDVSFVFTAAAADDDVDAASDVSDKFPPTCQKFEQKLGR